MRRSWGLRPRRVGIPPRWIREMVIDSALHLPASGAILSRGRDREGVGRGSPDPLPHEFVEVVMIFL
jgi:hypothetical protein